MTRKSERREWVIRPRRSGLLNVLKDVWDYRSLLGFVTKRSVLQLYRRTLLGIIWLAIRPAIAVVILVLMIRAVGISTGPVPLLLFITVGFALWTLFQAGLRHGTRAITRGRGLIRRLNFPRVMLVTGSLAPAFIEFAVVFVGVVLVLGYFAYTGTFIPEAGLRLFAIIPVLLFVMTLVVALTCVSSVLNSIATDTALSLNYLSIALLVGTPVMYPVSAIAENWQWAILLNPLAPALEIWRWALLGTPPPPLWSVFYAVTLTILILIGGLIFFLRWEQKLLDRN